MTARIAREKIEESILKAKGMLTEQGLTAKAESFYTDKNLDKSAEFTVKSILLFGNLSFGTPNMEEDEFCNYSICCEVKSGEVDEGELTKATEDFFAEIDALIKTLSGATSKEAVLSELSKKQSDDASLAAAEFEKEIRKVRIKLYAAVAVIVVIILGVIIGGSLLN